MTDHLDAAHELAAALLATLEERAVRAAGDPAGLRRDLPAAGSPARRRSA